MAKAVRRCYKKIAPGEWKVGKYCNPKTSKTKYASGKAKKKPPLKLRKETAEKRNSRRIAAQKIKNIAQPPLAPPTMSDRLQALIDAQKPFIGPPRPPIIMTRFD